MISPVTDQNRRPKLFPLHTKKYEISQKSKNERLDERKCKVQMHNAARLCGSDTAINNVKTQVKKKNDKNLNEHVRVWIKLVQTCNHFF